MNPSQIYKIMPKNLYDEAQATGNFSGSPLDLRDGYIHLSSPDQVRQTASLHFAGQVDLMIVAIEPNSLGQDLRWEPSRGGKLFPHFYANLPVSLFLWAKPLTWNGTSHDFPIETLS